MSDHVTLLINPTLDQVDYHVRAGGIVKAVIEDWEAFQATHHRHGKNNPIVFMPVLGYLRGVNCQRFDQIVVPNMEFLNGVNVEYLRRALKFNGELKVATSGSTALTKQPGWMISSYPRCGTHMVVTSLSQHPQLTTYGEVFNVDSQNGTHRYPDPRQVLEGFWLDTNIGFAAHAYIGQRGGVHRFMAPQRWYNDFWEHLPRRIKLISVRRRSLFARFVSHVKAKNTDVWNRYGDDKQKNAVQVEIDVNSLLKDAAFVKKCWSEVDRLYPERLVVYYEDLCEHWEREQRRMQEYLGVDYHELAPSSNKIGRSLKEDVKNYDHVVSVVERRGGMKQLEG